jgi:alginate O-acetyltransferase complex protein AlgI
VLFNSVTFALFFAVFYVLYVSLRCGARNLLLLGGSYLFYAFWDPRFVVLLILTTVTDYCMGLGIHYLKGVWLRRLCLIVSLSMNLGVLGFFKYFNFFADSFTRLLETIGFSPDPLTLKILLPAGISFYTFRSITYTVDIYRKQMKPAHNPLHYAVFVSFFPELIAGPIERARNFLPQIARERTITYPMVSEGTWLILLGFFKKVVVADNLAVIANAVFDAPGESHGLAVLLGAYAYTFQIYGDFSGYSDMARGLGRLMGFAPMQNFRMPYFAVNPQDFWRRWHISLSTWLRDYLYISLGGNRKGRIRTWFNLFMTMLLGGLWHGAAWNFVIWGAYHGAALILHRLCRFLITAVRGGKEEPDTGPALPLRILFIFLTFHMAAFGWIFFRINAIADFPVLMKNMFVPVLSQPDWILHMAFYLWPLFFLHLLKERSGNMLIVKEYARPARLFIYGVLFAYILLCGKVEGYEFIYAQF